MTEISFYHLVYTPFERALPKLMEKVVETGARAVIRTDSEERAEELSSVLWTYDKGAFLPHGTARDANSERQLIWITPDEENPNGADILVLTDGVTSRDIGAWRRCLDMFDGRDEVAVAEARRRWREYRLSKHELTYWQQTEDGGWDKKA